MANCFAYIPHENNPLECRNCSQPLIAHSQFDAGESPLSKSNDKLSENATSTDPPEKFTGSKKTGKEKDKDKRKSTQVALPTGNNNNVTNSKKSPIKSRRTEDSSEVSSSRIDKITEEDSESEGNELSSRMVHSTSSGNMNANIGGGGGHSPNHSPRDGKDAASPRSDLKSTEKKTSIPSSMKKTKKLIDKFLKKKDEEIALSERQKEDERRRIIQSQQKKQLEQAVSQSGAIIDHRPTPISIPKIISDKEQPTPQVKVLIGQNNQSDRLVIEKEKDSREEKEKKREFIVKELLHTEKTYIEGLEDAINKYYKPMLEESNIDLSISKDLVRKIFGNMEHILPINKQQLYELLEQRIANWTPNMEIGDLFVNFAHLLKMYTKYSNEHDAALKALEIAAAQPWFSKFCPAKVLIESQLISPIQRIPRYLLLLTDLYKNTPEDHPDEQNLLKAIKNIKNTAAHVNEGIAKHKNFDKLTSEGLIHLLAAHRTLALDEILVVTQIEDRKKRKKEKLKKESFKFYLFNDIFVFMDSIQLKKKVKEPKDLEQWPVELVWLERQDNNMLKLIGPCKILWVNCQQAEVQERWWQALVRVIDRQLENTQTHLKEHNWSNSASELSVRQGTFQFPDGALYQGWWNRGAMHGQGVLEFLGAVYQGEFADNIREGDNGSYYYTDGSIYRGQWKGGRQHGKGEMTTSSGDKYIGEWREGKKQGHGEMSFSNGDKYVGDWQNDNITGTGTLILKNGTTYVGPLVQGLYHGEGTLTSKQGTFFGRFQNGVKNGHGNMKWVNKSTYDGQWKNGFPHGHGKKIDALGFYEGEWEKGMRKGHGVMVYKEGSTYTGHWLDDKRHGFGVFENPSGFVQYYKGEWVKDMKSGKGSITFSNGDKFEGAMDGDQPHGHGILTCKMHAGISVQVEGKWYRGVREGKCQVRITSESGEMTNSILLDPEDDPDFVLSPFFPVISWDQ